MGTAPGDARKIVVSNQNLQFTWRNSEQLKGIPSMPSPR
jgi:hypothetical protein